MAHSLGFMVMGLVSGLSNAVGAIAKKLEDARKDLLSLAQDKELLEDEVARPNPYDAEIKKLSRQLRRVSHELGLDD